MTTDQVTRLAYVAITAVMFAIVFDGLWGLLATVAAICFANMIGEAFGKKDA